MLPEQVFSKMIRAVVFDVGGVLVSSPFHRILDFETKHKLGKGVCLSFFSFLFLLSLSLLLQDSLPE